MGYFKALRKLLLEWQSVTVTLLPIPEGVTLTADHCTSLASPFFYSNNHSTNKVLKSKVEKIDKEVAKKNVSHLHHKYYLEEKLLVNEICLKHGKSHEEKAAADLEFDSQELHEMLNDVRLNKFRT